MALIFIGTLMGFARADDAATAKKLSDLGAQVTIDKSVTATAVSFKDCSKLGAEEFKLIGSLTGLKSLTLYGSCKGLTDETLPLLRNLTALETLNTDLMMLSDDGFQHFAVFKNLKQLSLFHVSYQLKGFTGRGFKHLKELPNLRTFTYAGSTCGDDAIIALAEVKQLRDLRTWHTWSTPDATEHLTKITHLTSLKYGQSLLKYDGKEKKFALTDSTIPAILKLQELESLALDEARLSLESLKQLRGLPKLKKLILERIDISTDDVEKLKVELKGVDIKLTPLTDEEKKRLDAMLAQPKPK